MKASLKMGLISDLIRDIEQYRNYSYTEPENLCTLEKYVSNLYDFKRSEITDIDEYVKQNPDIVFEYEKEIDIVDFIECLKNVAIKALVDYKIPD